MGLCTSRFQTYLLARTNRSGQTTVVDAVVVVSKWLAQCDPLSEHFDLFLRFGRRIRWQEVQINDCIEVLVVSVLQNRLKSFLAQIAHCSLLIAHCSLLTSLSERELSFSLVALTPTRGFGGWSLVR